MDIYEFDNAYRTGSVALIAGIDEAGRGPLAGPVVAAAVMLPPEARIAGLRDSKKVPEKERERLFYKVLDAAIAVGVGVSGTDLIETHNILGATKLAMAEAVKELGEHGFAPQLLLIDAVKLTAVSIPQQSPIKGDSKSASIAAASIIAKYTRDRMMIALHEIYPKYGFDRHKGYGTAEHLAAIKKFGPCPAHRRGFAGVKEMCLPLG